MSDVFREIEEDLRAERLQRLWQRYGFAVVVLAMVTVVAAGGYAWWRSRHEAALNAAAAEYGDAVRDIAAGQYGAALATLDRLRGGPAAYPMLARFAAADVIARQGKADDAMRAYDAIAAEASSDPALRDLARLAAAALGIGREPVETVVGRVEPLKAAASPWRFAAQEIQALAQLDAGQREPAMKIFRDLSDDGAAPEAVRARAAELLAALSN